VIALRFDQTGALLTEERCNVPLHRPDPSAFEVLEVLSAHDFEEQYGLSVAYVGSQGSSLSAEGRLSTNAAWEAGWLRGNTGNVLTALVFSNGSCVFGEKAAPITDYGREIGELRQPFESSGFLDSMDVAARLKAFAVPDSYSDPPALSMRLQIWSAQGQVPWWSVRRGWSDRSQGIQITQIIALDAQSGVVIANTVDRYIDNVLVSRTSGKP
jgi:hypothetical protein